MPIIILFVVLLIAVFVFFFYFFKYYIRSSRRPYSRSTFEALWAIEKVVLESVEFEEVTQKVVNIILTQLGYLNFGYQVIVLSLLDNKNNILKRIAISKTEAANKFLQASPIPFKDIIIPLDATGNILVKAIQKKSMHWSTEVADVLYPALPKEWVSKFQKELGIKTTLAFPVLAKDKVLGAMIFSLNKDKSKISIDEWAILDSFVGAVGIALDNALLFKTLNDTSLKLSQANIRLEELDQLKDDFVSVASHELRTPMTAIKSFLWMALNKQQDNMTADLKRYLDHAYVSTERLISLVNDMLNISRIEGGRIALRLSEIDPVSMASDICEELAPKAAEKNILLTTMKANMPKVLCDADKMHEVFLNFIGNSLKFTPEGGKIWINFRQDGEVVIVEINDNGRGISKQDLSKLFTKFGRLDNSYVKVSESAGTGLGLYIAKSLIELHKGQVSVESDGLDKGAKFSFSLPIVGSKTAEILADSAPKETGETKELEKTNINL